MKPACMTFLAARLEELTLSGGLIHPFSADDEDRTIFFRELPTDFLHDSDYAVCCLPLIDRTTKHGALVKASRDQETKLLSTVRRRYKREIVFRCLIYGAADELYGTENSVGLVDRFVAGVAQYHHIASSDNYAILVNPQDAAPPWDARTEMDRKLKKPALAIVRIQFQGGVQVTKTIPLIPSFTIVESVSNSVRDPRQAITFEGVEVTFGEEEVTWGK